MGRRGEAGWGGSGLGRAGCWWTLQGGGSGRGDRLGEAPRATALSFFAFFRAWVSPVLLLVAAMWVPPFHFLSVDFLLPYRLLCNASECISGTIHSTCSWNYALPTPSDPIRCMLGVAVCVPVRASACQRVRRAAAPFQRMAYSCEFGTPWRGQDPIHALHVCTSALTTHSHTHTHQIRIRVRSASNGKPVSDQLRFFFAFSMLVMVSAKHI